MDKKKGFILPERESRKNKIEVIKYIIILIATSIALIFAIDVSFLSNSANNDIGWMLNNGWHIMHYGYHYRLSDSWVTTHPYFSTGAEWLSDLLYYLIYVVGKWEGLVVFDQLLIIAGLILVYFRFRNTETPFDFLIGLLIFVFGISEFMVNRSQIFSYLFFVLYLYLRNRESSNMRSSAFYFREPEKKWNPWIWLLLIPIWACLHGGFMIFYPLFIIDALTKKDYRSLLIIPLSLIEVTIIMPNHLYNVIYPFIGISAKYIQHNMEFQPMNFGTGILMALMLVLGTIGIASWSSMKINDKIIFLFLGLFALHSIRNLVFYAIFLYAVVPSFSVLKKLYAWKSAEQKKLFMMVYLLASVMLTLILPNSLNTQHAFQSSNSVDQPAIHYLMTHRSLLHFCGYEPMQYSDELAYLGEPIYVDGQGDVWSGVINPKQEKDIMDQFTSSSIGLSPINQLIGYSKMNYLLVRNDSVMDFQLQLMKGQWARVFHDKKVNIYVKHSLLQKLEHVDKTQSKTIHQFSLMLTKGSKKVNR